MEGHFQHSYDYDGMASLKSEEEYQEEENNQENQAEYFRDEDRHYEEWRENCFEELQIAFNDLVESFIQSKNSYYKNKKERILEHMKTYAIEKLDELKVDKELTSNGPTTHTNL